VSVSRQQELYESIHDEYSRHLYDDTSNAYRDQFINAAMFKELDLNHCDVAEIMCGIGQATQYIQSRYPTARCRGYDISRSACEDYTRVTGCPATVCDIVAEPLPESQFDTIVVVGGLHHVASERDKVIASIHAALKPGGILVMMEPNADYVLEAVRKIWYRRDRFFDADSEQALSYGRLRKDYAHLFDEKRASHLGGPGYFVILMSLVLRIPLKAKPLIAPVFMQIEKIWNRIPVRQAHAIFVAQWKKRPAAGST
jgi:SAM-dependent methyltransferase